MNKTTKHMLAAAAIASIVGISSTTFAKGKGGGKKGKAKTGFHCEGGNMCGGKSKCKSEKNASCGGKNGCAAQGWVDAKDEADCKTMQESAKTAAASKAAPATETKTN